MPGGPPTNDTTDPPAPLVSSWRARADAGEPVALVRVRNLQASISVGRDAWGRPGVLQPVLLSSEVSFARPFSGNAATAAAGASGNSASGDTDELDAGTVHYGSLSKTLLSSLELWGQQAGTLPKAEGVGEVEAAPRTADVLELLWVRMTGRVVDGSRVALPLDQLPFLDAAKLRSLALTIALPKASLLGAGVSLTTTASFREEFAAGKDGGEDEKGERANSKNPLRSYSRCLRIRGLHVPTLIGVNANEREARQMVVADVEIDRYDAVEDVHSDLEKIIVETIEASSFKTLEALASHVANRILSDFRIGDNPAPMKERGWKVRVCLEKPIAVPFAECPSVEVIMG